MPVYRLLINGQVPAPVVAQPPPAPAPAPPPPAPAPASAAPQLSQAQLAAAGVTQAQVDAADAAGRAAAAGAAALLAGEGSQGIANAEADAGATPDVLAAIIAAAIPSVAEVPVGSPGASGAPVAGTDDLGLAAALANGNAADLSDLPGWELLDPFGLQEFGVTNPPLKGGGAVAAIGEAASASGIDVLAVIADALLEGAGGGIGDGGLAYGPFQDHLTEFSGRPFYGKGKNNAVVNAWAWTENGIRYSVRQMATSIPSAKGLRGHAAVYAIVYGYERPSDKAGAYKARAAMYDKLVQLGSGWAAYAVPLFKGPSAGGAVDTQPIATTTTGTYRPAGVVAQWRSLVDVFKEDVPKQRSKVDSLSDSLMEVFK